VQPRRHQLEALDGREHRNRRSDRCVGVEERRAGDAEHEEDRRTPPDRALRQRQQRQRAALAAVVGAQDEHDVFEGDDQRQRPDEQRNDAHDLELGEPVAPGRPQPLAQRVERAGADVAVDDADRAEHELPGSGGAPPVSIAVEACIGPLHSQLQNRAKLAPVRAPDKREALAEVRTRGSVRPPWRP
jgi:hypothetical protein